MRWTLALAASGSLGDDSVPAYGGIDLPILLLVGGVVVGILLALLCRVLVDLTARRRAAAADRKLRAAVHEVSQELVVRPVEHELDAFRTVRNGLDAALGNVAVGGHAAAPVATSSRLTTVRRKALVPRDRSWPTLTAVTSTTERSTPSLT